MKFESFDLSHSKGMLGSICAPQSSVHQNTTRLILPVKLNLWLHIGKDYCTHEVMYISVLVEVTAHDFE